MRTIQNEILLTLGTQNIAIFHKEEKLGTLENDLVTIDHSQLFVKYSLLALNQRHLI